MTAPQSLPHGHMARLAPPIRRLVACCLALLACGAAWGAASALDYGIELQAPDAQRPMLENHLDLYRWRGRERLDEAQLQRLVRQAPAQIREFLSTQGYYAPNVTAELEQRDGKWRARLLVEPGDAVRVGEVTLQVSGPFDDGSAENRLRLQKIREDWLLPPGAPFRHEDWEAAKRHALRALLMAGYPAANVNTSKATVDPANQRVALALTLDSGPPFTFGELEIHGLARYPASIVARLNPIEPGSPYSQASLLDLQARLQDTPYFAGVSVTAPSDPAQPRLVPVQVELTENPAKKLGLGIGMSTDAGPRGQTDYRDLNFLGRAWALSGALKADGKRQSLGSEIHLPLSASGHRDSFNALLERTDIEGEITRKIALGAKRSRIRDGDEIAYSIRYFLEGQDIAATTATTRDRRAALAPSWSWTRRHLDNLLYPTHGYLLNFQADIASRALLSDRDFGRGYARAVGFLPLGKRDQLSLRGELGVVAAKGRDGIPSDFLFRSGGDQTVRGYAYQSLGVREGDAIVGGRYLAVASLEYVHWFLPQWGAALFVDAGVAADSLADLKAARGYGAGARWKSPVGPLNLDIAYGQITQEVRLHFSVGINF